MNIKSHQLFAQLCESIVFEDSTSLDLIKRHPGGAQVISTLHKEYGLPHDQKYERTPKMSWSIFKSVNHGSWAIIEYPGGTGAIKQMNEKYTVLASTGGAVETLRESHGGAVMNWLKSRLGGNPRALYVGRDTGDAAQKRRDRVRHAVSVEKSGVTMDSLMIKFKPLYVKATNAAMADIKGIISMMIKNNAFYKAEAKLNQLKQLDSALQELEQRNDRIPSIFKSAINNAVILSAGHYYPEQTGAIEKRAYSALNSESSVGVDQLLKDIQNGDTNKLGTVLAFFKRGLITA